MSEPEVEYVEVTTARDRWIAWGAATIAVLAAASIILTLVLNFHVSVVASDTNTLVQQIKVEQAQRASDIAKIASNTRALEQLGLEIERALSASRHPSEVDQSVLFQLCHAVNHIATTQVCRIP